MRLQLEPDRLPRRIIKGAVYVNVDFFNPRWPSEDDDEAQARVVVVYDGRNDYESALLADGWEAAGAAVTVLLICPASLDHVPMGLTPMGVPRHAAYRYDPTADRWIPTRRLVKAVKDFYAGDEVRVRVDLPRAMIDHA